MGWFSKTKLEELQLEQARILNSIHTQQHNLERWQGIRRKTLAGRDPKDLDASTRLTLHNIDRQLQQCEEAIKRLSEELSAKAAQIRDHLREEVA